MFGKVEFKTINEREVRKIISQLLILIILLICAGLVLNTMRPKYIYFTNKTVETALIKNGPWQKTKHYFGVDFKDVHSIQDIADYITHVYLHMIFESRIMSNTTAQHFDKHPFFKKRGLIVGFPRIRIIRVKPTRCKHKVTIEDLDKYPCYPVYSSEAEDKDTFHGYRYKSDARSIRTEYYLYSGGGYSLTLGYDYNKILVNFDHYFNMGWVDRSTRLVVLEHNIFYGATEMFQMVKIYFEIFPTGLVVPSFFIQSVPIKCFLNMTNYILATGIIFYIIILYYTLQEFQEFRSVGFKAYFKKIHNYPDLILVLTSYMALGYNIWHPFEISRVKADFKQDRARYINMDPLLNGWNIYVPIMAVLIFSAWLKVLRFVSFHRTLRRLALTMQLSAKNIIGFFFVFMVTLYSFAQMATIIFNDKVPQFRAIYTSITSIMRILMGDFNYMPLYVAHPLLAPFFFVAITVTMYGISLNLFVAIFLASYSEVKSSLYVNDMEVIRMILHGFKSYFCFWRWRQSSGVEVLVEQPIAENLHGESEVYKKPSIQMESVKELTESLARLTERTANIERVLDRLARLIDLISRLQDSSFATEI